MRAFQKADAKGFTLVELLIVVAIIGILAAVAVPNLIVGQQRARYTRAAGDTRSIISQAMVVTIEFNQTPVTDMGFAADPTFLWRQPLDPLSGQALPVYMTQVDDPWAPGTPCAIGAAAEACYQFNEVDPTGGGSPGPNNVVYSSWTVGADAVSAGGWDGIAAMGGDDLGTSTSVGCTFGLGVPISSPC